MFGNDSILGNLLVAGVIGIGGLVATCIAGRVYRVFVIDRRSEGNEGSPKEGGSTLGTRKKGAPTAHC